VDGVLAFNAFGICLHAVAVRYSQCDTEERDAVASGGSSAALIFKTIADPQMS
jgi:hypothetical protein